MTRALAVALLAVAGCAGTPSQGSPFAGTWVMTADGRTLMVLTLEAELKRLEAIVHPLVGAGVAATSTARRWPACSGNQGY